MMLLLGALTAGTGLVYLFMTLREGVARDRSGLVLARRRGEALAYFSMVGLFAAMIVLGAGLILLALGLI